MFTIINAATAHEHGMMGEQLLLQRVESAVRTFRGAAEPFDDATSMVVRIG